jgi:hypothetical protein
MPNLQGRHQATYDKARSSRWVLRLREQKSVRPLESYYPRTPNHSDHPIPLKVIVLGKKRLYCTRMSFRMLPQSWFLPRASRLDAIPSVLYAEQILTTCQSLFAQSNVICVALLWWYQRLSCVEIVLVPVGYSRNPGD